MHLSIKSLIVLAALSVTAPAAFAETIDFSNQPTSGPNAFTTDTQGNFTVTNQTGQFYIGPSFGDPVPDLFIVEGTAASIQVVRNDGGDFNFSSIDLANYGGGTYSFLGTLGGVTEFSTSGSISETETFDNYNPGDGSVTIDNLVITLSGNVESDLDNIVVNLPSSPSPVPEPSSFLFLGTGLLGIAGAARRRFHA